MIGDYLKSLSIYTFNFLALFSISTELDNSESVLSFIIIILITHSN